MKADEVWCRCESVDQEVSWVEWRVGGAPIYCKPARTEEIFKALGLTFSPDCYSVTVGRLARGTTISTGPLLWPRPLSCRRVTKRLTRMGFDDQKEPQLHAVAKEINWDRPAVDKLTRFAASVLDRMHGKDILYVISKDGASDRYPIRSSISDYVRVGVCMRDLFMFGPRTISRRDQLLGQPAATPRRPGEWVTWAGQLKPGRAAGATYYLESEVAATVMKSLRVNHETQTVFVVRDQGKTELELSRGVCATLAADCHLEVVSIDPLVKRMASLLESYNAVSCLDFFKLGGRPPQFAGLFNMTIQRAWMDALGQLISMPQLAYVVRLGGEKFFAHRVPVNADVECGSVSQLETITDSDLSRLIEKMPVQEVEWYSADPSRSNGSSSLSNSPASSPRISRKKIVFVRPTRWAGGSFPVRPDSS